jgi:hypothetical protein
VYLELFKREDILKHLALVSLLVFSGLVHADEFNTEIIDQGLRSAEEIDQEISEQQGEAQAYTTGWRHGGGWGRPSPRPYPRPYPGPYPRTIPVPIPVPVPRQIVCYADNEFGQRFSGWSVFASSAQQHAMNECYRYSQICYARGCY